MPLAFPSHQGLISPLWRRWPDRFHVLGLCVGAAMPDVVDGIGGPIAHGHLGQWIGHSLLGLFTLCLAGGMLLTWLIALFGAWISRFGGRWKAAGNAVERWNRVPPHLDKWRSTAFVAFSVWLGTLSHLVFDFVSHTQFMLLYPWYVGARVFPNWWYTTWFRIPLPGYRDPYPAGPHWVIWLILGIMGILMLFWPWIRHKQGADHVGAE